MSISSSGIYNNIGENTRKSLNFAIVGCGQIGARHALHIQNSGTLVAVCDILSERSGELGEKYGALSYTNLEEMIAAHPEIDVLAVCTPNGLHAQHSILALKAGLHVICEKPMALSVRDCEQMIRAAEDAGKNLFIVKQNRFNPPVAAVKKLADQGKLGKIFSLQANCFWNRGPSYYENSWRGSKDMDGGTLFTQFSHFVDLLWWLGGEVGEVCALGENFNHEGMIAFEDTGAVLLRFKNGTLGVIHYTVSTYKKNMEGSLTIIAEKGTVKIGGEYLNTLEYQCIDGVELMNLSEGNPPNNYGQYTGSMSNHDKVYDNVVDVLLGNGQVNTSGWEGLKSVEIIEKIYQVLRK